MFAARIILIYFGQRIPMIRIGRANLKYRILLVDLGLVWHIFGIIYSI